MKTSTLTIDGKKYQLAYDFNCIADEEQSAGCNLLNALENMNDITAGQLRGLLYAALIAGRADGERSPAPTLAEAGRLCRVDTIGIVTEALAEAYVLTLSEERQAEARAAKAEALAALEEDAERLREENEPRPGDPGGPADANA